MTIRKTRGYMKSRWDARYLIKAIMRLLPEHEKPGADYVLSVVAAAIRGYSKAYLGHENQKNEERIYAALKEYAREKYEAGGKDSGLMERFIITLKAAESEIFGEQTAMQSFAKPCAGFPIDSLTPDEQNDFQTYVSAHFGAKLYCSDGNPRKGMLVFQDVDGLEGFGNWMKENHPELCCPEFDDGSWRVGPDS